MPKQLFPLQDRNVGLEFVFYLVGQELRARALSANLTSQRLNSVCAVSASVRRLCWWIRRRRSRVHIHEFLADDFHLFLGDHERF